jgi:hypothetical protein
MRKFVAVNERGLRVGEDHPKAVLTDAEVVRLLDLHDSGIGYKRLARMFDISRSQARNYCKGRQRCQLAAGFREVHIPSGGGV